MTKKPEQGLSIDSIKRLRDIANGKIPMFMVGYLIGAITMVICSLLGYLMNKCERCDGFYRHADIFTTLTSNPPQKLVRCDDCGDKQYIL